MRAQVLDHDRLLELDPDGGAIRFAGQRALLIDAVAMGLLSKQLIDSFGLTAARTVLTHFGYAHGWRTAEAMKEAFTWESEEERRRAGSRLLALEGLLRLKPGTDDPLSPSGITLDGSYEAEQHLLHFGRSDVPVCATICGLLSESPEPDIYVLEDRCVARGDAACHLVARKLADWGPERAGDLARFDPRRLQESLPLSLRRLTETIKESESKVQAHRRALARLAPDFSEPSGIVARGPEMQRVVDLGRRVAKVVATVLITGESGVGKERIARLVHDESARAAGPFIAINCAAVSETLLESELFGHARGAFTGATQDRPGLFEAANGGTLLLDEVGEVSTGMQVKLLRVLQEREVRRVGENKSRRVNVRILAATNRDLGEQIERGAFRSDLYYRLKVVELHVPPLRDRPLDILVLARVLLASAALRAGREMAGLSAAVADQLQRYPWPGNVRELENAMERAAALAVGDRVELVDLPEDVRQASPHSTAASGEVRPIDDVVRDYTLAALEQNEGNRTRTAEQLEIGSATLYRWLKKWDEDR